MEPIRAIEQTNQPVNFSPRACAALMEMRHVHRDNPRHDVFHFLTLNGTSLRQLSKTRLLVGQANNLLPNEQVAPSRKTEVAITAYQDPNRVFIPGSINAPFQEQIEQLARYREWLMNIVPDVDVVLGTPADYVDLTLTLLDETGRRLFGGGENHMYTITMDSNGKGPGDILVGRFSRQGLEVLNSHDGNGYPQIGLAPLIVPAELA